MMFEVSTPSIVKSIRQRELLNTWLRLFAKNGQVPRPEDFRPERLNEELPDLVFLRVERELNNLRFIIERDGSGPANAHGSAGKGRYLDDYLGARLGADVTTIYEECVRRARPAYTIAAVDDIYGRSVDYERLLLPFFDSTGDGVQSIIASLKTISESGGFEIKNLMRDNETPLVWKVRVVIDRELVHHRPGRIAPDDIIELT